jgi:hypothetical protein
LTTGKSGKKFCIVTKEAGKSREICKIPKFVL